MGSGKTCKSSGYLPCFTGGQSMPSTRSGALAQLLRLISLSSIARRLRKFRVLRKWVAFLVMLNEHEAVGRRHGQGR